MKHKAACDINGSSTGHYIPALIKRSVPLSKQHDPATFSDTAKSASHFTRLVRILPRQIWASNFWILNWTLAYFLIFPTSPIISCTL